MADSVQRRRPLLRGDRDRKETCDKMEQDVVSRKLTYVNLCDINAFSEDIDMLSREFEDIGTPDLMRQTLMNTFAKCLEDRKYTIRAGAFFGTIHCIKIEDDTVRSLLLSTIQKELEDNNFQGDRERFLNAVLLLAELYFHIRFDNQTITVLGGELIKYFRSLLTGDERELEVLAISLIVNGPALKKDKPASYRRLSLDMRIALVSRELTRMSKSWLLLILDMESSNFQQLPEELMLCHMNMIGDKNYMKLKRWRPVQQLRGSSNVQESLPAQKQSVRLSKSSDDYVDTSGSQFSLDATSLPGNHWGICEKKGSSNKRQSPNRGQPNDRRHSPVRLCSPEEWGSPDCQDFSSRQHSSEFHPQREFSRSTTQRWTSETSNRPQKSDGRYQRNQNSHDSQKSNQDRRSFDTARAGYRGHRKDKIPGWQNDHDDRVDKYYN